MLRVYIPVCSHAQSEIRLLEMRKKQVVGVEGRYVVSGRESRGVRVGEEGMTFVKWQIFG